MRWPPPATDSPSQSPTTRQEGGGSTSHRYPPTRDSTSVYNATVSAQPSISLTSIRSLSAPSPAYTQRHHTHPTTPALHPAPTSSPLSPCQPLTSRSPSSLTFTSLHFPPATLVFFQVPLLPFLLPPFSSPNVLVLVVTPLRRQCTPTRPFHLLLPFPVSRHRLPLCLPLSPLFLPLPPLPPSPFPTSVLPQPLSPSLPLPCRPPVVLLS